MGILWRFTLRSLAANRSRTIVSIVGVVLSCALITGILTTVTSIDHALLARDISLNGTWQVFTAAETDESVAELVADPHTTNVVARRTLGFAQLEDGSTYWPAIVSAPMVQKGTGTTSIQGISGDVAPWPEAAEGRRPQTTDELMVPRYLLDESAYSVGDTLTVEVGQAIARTDDGVRVSSPNVIWSTGANDGSADDEVENALSLEATATHTYTIVGAYENGTVWSIDNAGAFSGTTPFFTGPAPEADPTTTLAVYATTDFGSYGQIDDWAERVTQRTLSLPELARAVDEKNVTTFPGGSLNTELLRYMGMTDNRAIWDSLWGVAAVLVTVVVVASITLVYTSFAISVAERTRQFGLLRGIGASRAQLRLTVFMEALLIGLAGIPLGIVAGVAGTAVALQVSAKGMGYLMGDASGISLWVSWPALLVCALVTLFVLVASAMLPALRASRVSAVQAIRQSGLSGGAARGKRMRPGSGRIARRLFGTPGLVAHRHLSRAGSRGRIVVLSLAVSCALIMTGGLVDSAMQPVMTLADDGAPADTDVSLTVYGHPRATPDELLGFLREAEAKIESTTDVRVVRSYYVSGAHMVASLEMLDPAARDSAACLTDTSWGGALSIIYLNPADWSATLDTLGLDPTGWDDPAHPRAIAVGSLMSSDGSSYQITSLFRKTGSIEVCRMPEILERDDADYYLNGITFADGKPAASYAAYADGEPVRDTTFTLDELGLSSATVEVGALAEANQLDLHTDALRAQGLILLPDTVLASDLASSLGVSSWMAYYATADHAATTTAVGLAIDSLQDAGEVTSGYTVSDVDEIREETVNVAAVIRLFVLLFSIMTMLIALANVFNTLTNSIILRTREFATLSSVGMGRGQFVRMLAYECASFALRGLAIGFALAALVGLAMSRAMATSFVGLSIAIPWPYVALSVGAACLVLALSTQYAVRRAMAQNTVEALRSDAL